jgi:Tol biopolymer transport system component
VGTLGDPMGVVGGITLSPDGKSAAATIFFSGTVQDIWIFDTARGIPTRFTFEMGKDREPVWSPDGKWLYFDSDREGQAYRVYRKPSNGTGADELVFGEEQNSAPTSISPDGKLLLFQRAKETNNDLWTLPAAQTTPGKIEPQAFLKTQFNEARGSFSPDGAWVVYQSNESGENQIYAAPFPGSGGKRQISTNGGIDARWSRNGKEIFYVTADGAMMAAEVAARNGTLEIGKVEKLFDGVKTTAGLAYDVTAEGKFLLADDGVAGSRPMTLVQNWVAALRK